MQERQSLRGLRLEALIFCVKELRGNDRRKFSGISQTDQSG